MGNVRIRTITLNPALDRTMYFDKNITAGGLNRASGNSILTLGGKGTNVSCIYKIFGVESEALGFMGGINGETFVKLLSPFEINTDFTGTECETRMNIKIITKAESGTQCTEFNESGGIVSESELVSFMDGLKNKLPETDLLFMGGSVPRGIKKSIYADIIRLASEYGVKCIADCDGEALSLCMNGESGVYPYMIKPNKYELELYTGKKYDLIRNCDAALAEIFADVKNIYESTGVRVLCTLSEFGGLYCGREGLFHRLSPTVELLGFTGAGDTFLSAFCAAYFGVVNLDKYMNGRSLAETAVDFAVSASSAKVELPGTLLPEFDAMFKFM